MTNSGTLIFGGTFDPIHLGHLQVAKQVQDCFHFSDFLFLPSQVPVHKKNAQATVAQRIHMLNLALSDYPIEHASICLDEINRHTPSYTIDTLRAFRKKTGPMHPLTFLMGLDAFLSLATWHEYTHLLEFANFLVIHRKPIPVSFPKVLQDLLLAHQTDSSKTLLTKSHGNIYFYDAGFYQISSQDIRSLIIQDLPYKNFVTDKVYTYLKEHKLYQRMHHLD